MEEASTTLGGCKYDHLQFFVDELRPLSHYKAIEDRLNEFARLVPRAEGETVDVAPARKAWRKMGRAADPDAFEVHGRDLVEQMLYGFGWRITGQHEGAETRSLLLSTPDMSGARFVLTCNTPTPGAATEPRPAVTGADRNIATTHDPVTAAPAQVGGSWSTLPSSQPYRKEPTARRVPQGDLTLPSSQPYEYSRPSTSIAAAPVADGSAHAATFDHFARTHLERYFAYHSGAQGIGVLGFELETGQLDLVQARYEALHPELIVAPPHHYPDGTRVLDVFAYYRGEKGDGASGAEADPGTVLRFLEKDQNGGESGEGGEAAALSPLLPGLVPVPAVFAPDVLPAYCDHWVSNVVSRVGFLQTLEDTLGFTTKVDFNAGVVAAGEAQIESTVTGNASPLVTSDPGMALRDRAQVFLPTNNALSPVGHVHWYLEQLGQGIQHVASRVSSLPDYVQRANDMRAVTGEGVTFLNIPRTYYGLLEPSLLTCGGVDGELLTADCPSGLAEEQAIEIVAALRAAGLVDSAGALSLGADAAALDAALLTGAPSYRDDLTAGARAMVLRVLRRSCFVNLWKLMGDQLTEETYLSIVRNKILIDVQGEDVLMQIFTNVVLQREAGTEAPFLEFIQRVCACGADGEPSCEAIRPGCGGFGIRNFLTLFLSIEVSKAMLESQQAAAAGREAEAAFHERRVELFTEQLVEANPVLTDISDCMTAEGRALDAGDADAADEWRQRKEAANVALTECSQKYNGLMATLRETGW